MKTFNLFKVFMLSGLMALIACQSEENTEIGENPNANSSTSEVADNYSRASMEDGSEDDFLDGNSCTKVLFPFTAIVNGETVTVANSLGYEQVLQIIGRYNDDEDTVEFNFPIRVRLSNYTEATVETQSEFNTLKEQCESAEEAGNDAISCVEINYPITMLTYNVRLEQTGSVVVQSKQQLYNFMNGLDSDELFSASFPFSATLSNGTTVQINNDTDFKNAISTCEDYEEDKDEAEETARSLEAILIEGKFKVESFINDSVDTANDYADYTIDFANDLSVIAKDEVNATTSQINGTYSVSSEIDVFFNLNFGSNTAVSALNNDWILTTYSNTVVELKSRTNATTTLKIKKI